MRHAAALLVLLAPLAAAAKPLVPRGAKPAPDGDAHEWRSPKGFAATLKWYQKELDHEGIVVTVTPPEEVRGTLFARILTQDPAAPFAAIHIFLADGKTFIYLVPPQSAVARGSSNGRTPDSGSGYLGSNPSPRTVDPAATGTKK